MPKKIFTNKRGKKQPRLPFTNYLGNYIYYAIIAACIITVPMLFTACYLSIKHIDTIYDDIKKSYAHYDNVVNQNVEQVEISSLQP